jgi:hypothetical protein
VSDFYAMSRKEAYLNKRADDPGKTGYIYSKTNTKVVTPREEEAVPSKTNSKHTAASTYVPKNFDAPLFSPYQPAMKDTLDKALE